MAEIDKTWVTGEQYNLVRRWAYEYGDFEIPEAHFKDKVSNYIHEYDEVPEQAMLWNTPEYFDVFLKENCPFDFIQKRLKEQYGNSYYHLKYGTPYFRYKNKQISIKFDKNIDKTLYGDIEVIVTYNDEWILYNAEPEYFLKGALPFSSLSKTYSHKKHLQNVIEDMKHFNLLYDSVVEIIVNNEFSFKGIVKAMI